MDKNFVESFGKIQNELEKRGLYICQRIEYNQKILDNRLANNDIPYSVYREKTKWNKELSEFMTFLNSYREMADSLFIEYCFDDEM